MSFVKIEKILFLFALSDCLSAEIINDESTGFSSNSTKNFPLSWILNFVFPKVTPVKDYVTVPYGPKGLDLSVSVPLNSLEKSYTRKKAGQIFNGYMERMMQEPWYKNETDRVMKESFIKQQWQSAKSEAKFFSYSSLLTLFLSFWSFIFKPVKRP